MWLLALLILIDLLILSQTGKRRLDAPVRQFQMENSGLFTGPWAVVGLVNSWST